MTSRDEVLDDLGPTETFMALAEELMLGCFRVKRSEGGFEHVPFGHTLDIGTLIQTERQPDFGAGPFKRAQCLEDNHGG